MKVCIVAGGKIQDHFLKNYMEKENYSLVFAVDKGLEFFERTNRKPDYIVGDFDSVDSAVLELFLPWKETKKMVSLNPQKDDTDMAHALTMAIGLGATEVHLFGGTGSRIDHVLGNLQLLGYALKQGVSCQLLDENNRIRMIDHSLVLSKEEQFGKYVSLLPYTPEVFDLTLEGFAYPLKNHILKDFYLPGASCLSGVSNEIVSDTARITFREGILVVVESRDS